MNDAINAAFEEIEKTNRKQIAETSENKQAVQGLGQTFSNLLEQEEYKEVEENVDPEIKIKIALLRTYLMKAENYGDAINVPDGILHTINRLTTEIQKTKEARARIETMTANQIVMKMKFIEDFIKGLTTIIKSTVTSSHDRRRLAEELKIFEENSKKKAALST